MERNIYSRAKISIKVLDVTIILGLIALVAVTVFLSVNGGFDISFDTAGGTSVSTQRLRYGETITEPDAPTRENYSFAGWYADKELTKEFDFNNSVATQSITVYAAWEMN